MNKGAVIAIIAVVALAAYAATGLYGTEPPERPAPSGEVEIGLLAATSGDFGAYGRENLEAAMLAEDDFNAYLEEAGEEWRMRLVARDTQSSPEAALGALEELDAAGISLVSGPETSASITGIKGYAAEAGMLLFSCCSTAPALAIPGDGVFRLITDDTRQGAVFKALLDHSGIDAVVPVWRGDVWGDGLHKSAQDAIGDAMDAGIRYEVGTTDFAAHAGDLAVRVQGYVDEHGQDRVAVLYMGFGEMADFVQEAARHDILGEVRWFGSDSNTNDAALTGGPAAGFVGDTRFTTVQISASDGPAFYAVRDHVRAETGREPSTFAHATYDTIWLIGLAVLEAGSAEAAHVADALPVVAASYEGAIGSTELNEAGDLAYGDYDIWGVRDGSWERLGKYSHAGAEITLDESGLGEVRVGMLAPYTGDLGYFGEEAVLATQLGVSDFNAHLEETGETWRMALETRDTGSGADALAGLESLRADGIGVVLGAASSATITGIKGYADSNGMLILGCCSSAPSLAIPGDSVFRMVPDDRLHGAALARLLEHEGIGAVVPVWRGDVWGDGLREAGASEFSGTADGGVRYETDTVDFAAHAADLAARVQGHVDERGADKVAVWYMGFSEMIGFVREAAQYDILGEVRWFGSGPNTKEISLVDDAVGGEFLSGAGFMMVQAAAADGPIADRVSEHARAGLGREPNSYSHAAYDAVWIAGLAISGAQSADPADVTGALAGAASEYGGALGGIEFNEAGDSAGADYDIWGVRDGAWKNLGTYSHVADAVELGGALALSGEITVWRLADGNDEYSHNAENAEAAELALAEFNRALDERGAGWDLGMEIIEYEEGAALDGMMEIASAGGRIVIGPDSSASVEEVAGYAGQNGMVLISCCSTAPSLAIRDGIFRLVPDDTRQAGAMTGLLAHGGIEAVVPAWRGDVWGDDLVEALRSEYDGFVDDGVRYEPGAGDFAAHAADLAARVQGYSEKLGAERTAVIYAGFGEAAAFMEAAASHGALGAVRWFGTDANAKDAGITGGSAASAFADTVRFVTVQAGAQDSQARDLVEGHISGVLGRTPSSYAYSTYDAVWIAGLALERTGGDTSAVAGAIPQVAGRYSGALGSITLNDAGDIEDAAYEVWGTRDGQWVMLGTYESGQILGLS